MKLGLNLIAAYCPNTPVNHETFADPIRAITSKEQIPQRVMMTNGFVHAEDIAGISSNVNEHAFRLVHIDGVWHVYLSFFGGSVGAFVRIPGPNCEVWRSADITAPIKSKAWTIRPSPLLQQTKVRVVWKDGRAIIPSLGL
jgi:hypothetical protein